MSEQLIGWHFSVDGFTRRETDQRSRRDIVTTEIESECVNVLYKDTQLMSQHFYLMEINVIFVFKLLTWFNVFVFVFCLCCFFVVFFTSFHAVRILLSNKLRCFFAGRRKKKTIGSCLTLALTFNPQKVMLWKFGELRASDQREKLDPFPTVDVKNKEQTRQTSAHIYITHCFCEEKILHTAFTLEVWDDVVLDTSEKHWWPELPVLGKLNVFMECVCLWKI